MRAAVFATMPESRRLIALAAAAGACWAGAVATMSANAVAGLLWCGPMAHEGLPVLFGHCALCAPAAAFTLVSIGALAKLARQTG